MSSIQSPEPPERSATPTASPDRPTTDVENKKENVSFEPPSRSSSGSDKSDGSIDSIDIPQNLVSLDIETDENHKDCVALLSELRRSMWRVLKRRLSQTVLEWSPALRIGGGRHRSARVLDKDLTSSVQEGKVRIPVRCEDGKLIGYLQHPWARMHTLPQGFRVGGSKNASKPWDPSPLRDEAQWSPTSSPEAPEGEEAPLNTQNGNECAGE